ncbi:hypothetical protein WJX77_004211 [Trebouxia sp. C0004]
MRAAVAQLQSERKANEAVLADEQEGKRAAQAAFDSERKAKEEAHITLAAAEEAAAQVKAALAEARFANQKLQADLTALQEEMQAAVAQLQSESKANEAVLADEQEGKRAAQALLESERKASRAALAEGNRKAQACLQDAQEHAKSMAAAKSTLEQEVKRMAQSALAREAKLRQDRGTAVASLQAALAEAKTATQIAEANLLAESEARFSDQVAQAERILKLGSVMDKKDDHVASLQQMAVYYRDCCGVPIKLGPLYDAPDPDEEYPLQDLEFILGEEAPPDQRDHYMDLARRCIDNRRDPINAWDRWLPQQPVVESVGEGLRMPAKNEWLRFPKVAGVRPKILYGEAVGHGAQGVVFPGRRMNSQTTSTAIKMYQHTPKSSFDKEWSQLLTAKACNNIVSLIPGNLPLWDSSTGRGYMFLEFAQGGDLERWLVKARDIAGIGLWPRAHECITYTPPQQAQVKSMIRDLFQGLQQLHDLSIVHNDVKPHNCLLKHQDNFLKLADLANSVQLQIVMHFMHDWHK